MALTQKQLEVKLGNRKIKLEDFGNLIIDLPDKVRPAVERHIAEFLREAFETDEPAYKLVRRSKAYPEVGGWFSSKQRKFVMALMRAQGRLVKTPTGWTVTPKNNRTGEVGRKWTVMGRGPVTIRNTAPYAGYLFSNKYQARQPGLVGWKKLDKLYEDNAPDAFADAADFIHDEFIRIFK